jgi:uncharacterized protein (TIGR02246 family)
VRDLEDHLEILNLVAAYGPLVDAGDADGTAELWTQDGTYDVDSGCYEGRSGIAAMVRSAPHQRLLERGCAHVTTPPAVAVDGDAAVAVTHSQLVVRSSSGGFDVVRATAHRWELVCGADGWRVHRRTSRLLGGDAAARDLLALRPRP